MRKVYLLLLLGMNFWIGFSQTTTFNYTRNLDIYKPYTSLAQEYMKFNDNVSSHTQTFSITRSVKLNEKYTWHWGLAYKRIDHVVYDKVKGYYSHYVSPSQGLDYYEFNGANLDLVSKSNSFGISNQFDYLLSEKGKISHFVGISNEIYLIESYISDYKMKSGLNFNDEVFYINLYPLSSGFGRRFLFSSANLALHYRFRWQMRDAISLGAKISLGSNLYSDWDQFKKYMWLGAGIELGFIGDKL